MIRWSVAIAALGIGLGACKKQVQSEMMAEVPVELPGEGDASAGADDPVEADPGAETPTLPVPSPKLPPAGKRAHEKVNDIVKLLEVSDVAKNRQALEALELLQRDEPELAVIDLNIGVAQHKLGNVSAAKAAWQTALVKDPQLGNAYLFLGLLREESGDLAGAEAQYRQGMAADPENIDVRVGLIALLRKQGRLDDTIAEAQKALRVNTMSTEIYNDVGLAYLERGEILLAKFMYQKALDIPGGEEKAYLHANLGWALYKEGKVPQATFRLKKAVELDPEYVPGLVYLARVYMEDRNYADTVDLLERAARKAPDNHGVQMNLGIAYRGVGRLDDAKKAYQRALVIDPTNPDPYFNLGVLQGDYFKAYDEAIVEFGRYKAGGGKDVALADQYIADIEREKALVERRKKAMEAATRREAERKERERLAAQEEERLKRVAEEEARAKAEEEARRKEEEARQNQPAPAPEAPAPDAPAPEAPAPDAPTPEPPTPEAPTPEGGE